MQKESGLSIKHINRSERDTYTFFDKRILNPKETAYYRSDVSLLFIQEGHGELVLNGQKMHFFPREVIVVGPYVPHQVIPETDGKITLVVFRMSAMGNEFINCRQLTSVRRFLQLSRYGVRCFGDAVEKVFDTLQSLENTYDFRQVINLLTMIDLLSHASNHEVLTANPLTTPSITKSKTLIFTIKKYIDDHTHEALHIEELARKFNMAESTFIRFFKSNMGVSFTKYLNNLRIQNACQLLTNSQQPVATIGNNVGYSCLSNFNRQFRVLMGTTPKEYRRTHFD